MLMLLFQRVIVLLAVVILRKGFVCISRINNYRIQHILGLLFCTSADELPSMFRWAREISKHHTLFTDEWEKNKKNCIKTTATTTTTKTIIIYYCAFCVKSQTYLLLFAFYCLLMFAIFCIFENAIRTDNDELNPTYISFVSCLLVGRSFSFFFFVLHPLNPNHFGSFFFKC